jgi:uncharacterized protein (TIGR02117 family)
MGGKDGKSGRTKRVADAARIIVVAFLGLLLVPLLYGAAAVAGGLLPANRNWTPADEGVVVFIRTNGVHTWIMVPTISPGMDWRPLLPATDIRDPRLAGEYLAIGWGNREFYLNTPTWNDLTAARAFHALFANGPSLMHVDHEPRPRPDTYHRPLILTQSEYLRLSRFILAGFQRGPNGFIPLRDRGYDRSDIFYEAVGPYNLFITCNVWTGRALRDAGVRMGVWTPFEQSIMMRFPEAKGG